MKRLKKIFVMVMMALLLCSNVATVFADETGYQTASDEARDRIRGSLNRYYSDLKMMKDISDETIKKMDKIYNSAMNYLKGANLSESELKSYESQVRGYLDEYAKDDKLEFGSTEKFLMLSNEVPIQTAEYNQQTFVVLSLINLGKSDIKDVVITPTVSSEKDKWPFVIQQAYDAQCIPLIQPASSTVDAFAKRMDIGWMYTVKEDAKSGCYPLTFHAQYYQDDKFTETDITTYINIIGNPENGKLGEDSKEDEKKSKPRIIVTGYTTSPETVYAGSVFDLTLKVQNTSKDTAVQNVLFNLEATVEGDNNTAAYAAFLPTSGSNSVYAEKIEPGMAYEMAVEMEVKADLAQKPYVLTVNMQYEDEECKEYTDTAKVSIPIKQEAKLDTGTFEVMPNSIAVGEQSNVMFSVFNTGKTTLYNVKVSYESDTVESGITYLGNIAPGATGNVDSMVTGIAPDMGEGIVKAVVTYEDEAGNPTRYEKDFSLYVYEMTFEEEPMDVYPTEPVEEEKGLPMIAVIGIIGLVVIVIIAVVVVIIMKKKKAKKQKEDLDLLDEDDV